MTSHPLYGIARAQLRRTFLVLGAIACASCSMNLRPQPETLGQSIAGQWLLQSPSREVLIRNLGVVLEQARAKQEQRERRRYPYSIPPGEEMLDPQAMPPMPSDDGSQAGGGPPRNLRRNWEIREQHEQQDALLNAVAPSNKLQIGQGPNRVEMLPDSGGWRRFTIGMESTLVNSYATLRIESGWQGNIFVVHSRDSELGMNIVERYQRVGNDKLRLQVQLSLSDVKAQTFAADYQLAQP